VNKGRGFQAPTETGMDDQRLRKLLAGLGNRGNVIGRFGGRRDLVRNAHGKPLPCCWSECWRDGSTKHQVVAPHDGPGREGDTLTYIFCGQVHRALWLGLTPPAKTGLIVP
jgi:hypothetical protein